MKNIWQVLDKLNEWCCANFIDMHTSISLKGEIHITFVIIDNFSTVNGTITTTIEYESHRPYRIWIVPVPYLDFEQLYSSIVLLLLKEFSDDIEIRKRDIDILAKTPLNLNVKENGEHK